MKRRQWLGAGAALMLAGATRAQPAAVGAEVIWPTVKLLDGGVVEPAAWRGSPVLVVFWATYCPFCKRHNAHVDKAYRALQASGLRVLGVALDTDEALVRQYMTQNNYRFPVALDGRQLQRQFTTRRVIPMTCLVDRQGRLVQAIPGEMFEEDVMDTAQSLLKRAV
jgi:peroxiredoxin